MTQHKAKLKAELHTLTELKKEILGAKILQLQAQKYDLEAKTRFYTETAAEWVVLGQFEQCENITSRVASVKTDLNKMQSQIERLQQERLKLTIAIKSLSRPSKLSLD